MRSAWLITMSALLCGAARAASLTYDAALDLAGRSAPTIEARSLQIDATRSQAKSAGALPDPQLSLGVGDFPVSGPLAGRPDLDNFSMVTVGISQDVPSGAKRRARSQVARADITQAQADLLMERRNVRVSTALAWIDLYYAERRLAALEDVAQKLRAEIETAPARLTSGATRPSAALAPRQALAAVADRRADIVAAVAKARADLGRWIGPAEGYEPAGPPPMDMVDAVALRAHLDELPTLRAGDAAISRAEAAAALAKADKRPDLGYEVDYSHRDPRFGDYLSAKVTVSLPIFGATRQDPMIAARLADVNRAHVEREAVRRELAAALDSDLADHAMHHERLARARETLVPLATRRAELETASYAGGTSDLADVEGAFVALAEAQIDVLDREAEAVRDGARIVLTYGSDDQ